MPPSLSRIKNKFKRQELFVKQKRDAENTRRDERLRRKREEQKQPELRERRLRQNVPATLERKRVWDEMDGDGDAANVLGASVDVQEMRRKKVAKVEKDQDEDDRDSMLDSDSDNDEDEQNGDDRIVEETVDEADEAEPANDTLSALRDKFPQLFSDTPFPVPKILITTSINSMLHEQAERLTSLFPHSVYIRRSAHRFSHKFSVREIAGFAHNRQYTTLLVLREDMKKPTGLSIVHLPSGPTFHFTISNWVDGRKLPGHGKPTNHMPELILNNFRTPLGILAAQLFRTLFPPQPEIVGRQVVTLHNQRDYIFVRRHRYVFREKRRTEKSVTTAEGQVVKGAEDIRAGLQELGPRFTLKLRRVDAAIGRGKKPTDVEWEWKARMEKKRTRFNL